MSRSPKYAYQHVPIVYCTHHEYKESDNYWLKPTSELLPLIDRLESITNDQFEDDTYFYHGALAVCRNQAVDDMKREIKNREREDFRARRTAMFGDIPYDA